MYASQQRDVQLNLVSAAEAAPLYEEVSVELGWPVDDKRLAALREANEKHLAALAERLKDAEENLGDVEVLDACLARADYLAKTGVRLDLCLCRMRQAIFPKLSPQISSAGHTWPLCSQLHTFNRQPVYTVELQLSVISFYMAMLFTAFLGHPLSKGSLILVLLQEMQRQLRRRIGSQRPRWQALGRSWTWPSACSGLLRHIRKICTFADLQNGHSAQKFGHWV